MAIELLEDLNWVAQMSLSLLGFCTGTHGSKTDSWRLERTGTSEEVTGNLAAAVEPAIGHMVAHLDRDGRER
jgi:hypothetical protein